MSVAEATPHENCKALLSKVTVTDTVLQSCLAHALTTENEEVMGVLLGNLEVVDGVPPASAQDGDSDADADAYALPQSKVATIWSSHIMQRSVRRSDRVEVPVERLTSAIDRADEVTASSGLPTRVIGWYHSHPQITSFPSSVDLSSQGTYQQMESGWVGLIFSVFHTDSGNRNTCSIHCFQTGPMNRHVKVPVEVRSAPQMGLPISIGPCHHAMLAMFGEELDAAVEAVKARTGNDAAAMTAALGLQQAQLFALERLVAEPSIKYLEWCSITLLEDEVKRLEAELKSLSP